MILKADKLAALLNSSEKDEDPFSIVPSPPDIELLAKSGAASIDLRLGTWFVSLRQGRRSHLRVDEGGAPLGGSISRTHYVPLGSEYFLHPRNFVLGTVLEWIRIPKVLAAYVIGKSSWGRRGLIIATATGVHPGFKGCLTLELANVGEIPIAIRPGMLICQLFVHTVESEPDTDHVDKSSFIGCRKPTIGNVAPDPIAKALGRAREE